MKGIVPSRSFRAGWDLPSGFPFMTDEKIVGLTFEYGPLCGDSCLCWLSAHFLPFQMTEKSTMLLNEFFFLRALLKTCAAQSPRDRHQLAVEFQLKWKTLSHNILNIRHLLSPCPRPCHLQSFEELRISSAVWAGEQPGLQTLSVEGLSPLECTSPLQL